MACSGKPRLILRWQNRTVIVFNNFAGKTTEVEVKLRKTSIDLYIDNMLVTGKHKIRLAAYGAAWIKEK